jgi:hypothetical protein
MLLIQTTKTQRRRGLKDQSEVELYSKSEARIQEQHRNIHQYISHRAPWDVRTARKSEWETDDR